MQDYFIWNNEWSFDNGLIINKLPPIVRPEERIEKITVPGRHGYMTQSDNTYESVLMTCECTLNNGNIDYIKQWLNGSGLVCFSNQEYKFYKARIINQISFEEILRVLHKFIVVFDCQPFAYDGDEIIEIDHPTSIVNLRTFESEPYIKIYATGDIDLIINSDLIRFTNVDQYIEIDTEIMECYKDTVVQNSKMIGDFPTFKVGENTISWIGNINKIEIKPRWRCL